MRKTSVLPLFFLLCTLALVGCGGGGTSPISAPLTSAPVGTYGAEDIQLQVTATGAQVALPCGQSGQITQPLLLDANGHFDVAGTIIPFQAAPVPPPKPVSARFTGATDGKTMTLTVTPSPVGAPSAGVYTLTYGASSAIVNGPCPG